MLTDISVPLRDLYSVCSTITNTSITNDILYDCTVPGSINRFRRSVNRAAGSVTTAG